MSHVVEEDEMASESLFLSGIPFEISRPSVSPNTSAAPNMGSAALFRRRKLARSPIVINQENVKRFMEREMESRGEAWSPPATPGSEDGYLKESRKRVALERLKKLRPVTPETTIDPNNKGFEHEMPSSSTKLQIQSPTMKRVGKSLFEKAKEDKNIPGPAAIVSPQRRPKLPCAFSYEILEESMDLSMSPPPPHTYVRELDVHDPPPLPLNLMTPPRGSEQVRSQLSHLKRSKDKGKGQLEKFKSSQEKAPTSSDKNTNQSIEWTLRVEAMATPESPLQDHKSQSKSKVKKKAGCTNENAVNRNVLAPRAIENICTPQRGPRHIERGSPSDGRELRKNIAIDVLGRLAQVDSILENSVNI